LLQIQGLGDLNRKLKKIQDKIASTAQEVSGEVSFEVLFNQGFMDKHSKFSTIDELFNHGGLRISSQQEFENIETGVLDKLVQENTEFSSWQSMYQKAANEYITKEFRKRGFDVK